MHVDYRDITEKLGPPDWYMQEYAFPRYGEFDPDEMSVYWTYAFLYTVNCQSCNKEFKIGKSFDDFDLVFKKVKVYAYGNNQFTGELAEVEIRKAVYCNPEDDLGLDKWEAKDLIYFLGMGDPPSHGCVGDTMGSIPGKILKGFQRVAFEIEEIPEFNDMDLYELPPRPFQYAFVQDIET